MQPDEGLLHHLLGHCSIESDRRSEMHQPHSVHAIHLLDNRDTVGGGGRERHASEKWIADASEHPFNICIH
jgi:hypothetical protein